MLRYAQIWSVGCCRFDMAEMEIPCHSGENCEKLPYASVLCQAVDAAVKLLKDP